MISIITINYNNREGLERTIKSVVSQTNFSCEYIVVDGNSSDGSKEILESYKNEITHIISENDTGIYNAMNKGIMASNQSYLLFLNSGDVLYKNSILAEMALQIETGEDIIYGNLVYQKGGDYILEEFPSELNFSFFYKGSLPHPASFIKRDLFDRVFYYNEALQIVADWEFFVCAICKYDASYKHVDFVISDFEVIGISCDPKNKDRIEEERSIVLKKHFPMFIECEQSLIEARSLLETNRFKMLSKIEKSKAGRKAASFALRFLMQFFK